MRRLLINESNWRRFSHTARANHSIAPCYWPKRFFQLYLDCPGGRRHLTSDANNVLSRKTDDTGLARRTRLVKKKRVADEDDSLISHQACDPCDERRFKSDYWKSPLREQQVRYQLSRNIERQKCLNAAYILDRLDLASCEEQLPPQSRQSPLSVFQMPDLDMLIALAALASFAKRCHLRYGATQGAREIYQNEKPGHRALYWLLSSDKIGGTDPRTAANFATLIAFGLVAENAHEHLRTWATALPTRAQLQSGTTTYNLFSGFKIRGSIDALAYWTSRVDPLADSFDFFRFCSAKSRECEHYVALSIPGKQLWHHLQVQEGRHVSVEDHDWFCRALAMWTRDPAELQMNRAILALYRPREPSPSPMLDFLRSCTDGGTHESSKFVAGFLNDSKADKGAEMMYWQGVRAAQQLQQRGNERDARWILNFLATRMPVRFERGRNSYPDRGKMISQRRLTKWEQSSLPNGGVRSRSKVWEPLRGLGGT